MVKSKILMAIIILIVLEVVMIINIKVLLRKNEEKKIEKINSYINMLAGIMTLLPMIFLLILVKILVDK